MLQEGYGAVVWGQMLNIGIGTQLQFQLGTEARKFKATGILVGMVPDEYLLIRVPAIPGILSRLIEGNTIVVRYIYAGNVYGFASKVQSYIQKPALIVFLTYPAAVESMNLRKTQRIECRFPATVKTDHGEYKAVIIDISLGGCRVCFEVVAGESSSMDTDQTVTVSFYLAAIAEKQVIRGRVQNLKKDGQLFEMGIRFDQKNDAVLNNVKHYIDSFAAF